MRFWLGLAIGLVVGAVAMYLGLARPWHSATPTTVAVATPDAGPGSGSGAKKKKKKGGRGTKRTSTGELVSGDDGDDDGGVGEGDTEETEPLRVLTEADRRMEWRGDELKMPPRVLDMEDGKEARSLDDGEISATVNRDGHYVVDCLVRAATGVEISTTVTVKMIVSGQGKVGKLKVQAPHFLFEEGALACVRRATAKFGFPATGAASMVVAPFELSSSR